ncbi:phosphatase PAP2 family protein [Prauserella oleivorans]|uniref:Phosphatase PAP2 family protein n=1 Tax=Prauserella oleivorans TaxID=1478153 RepID=A0ABW5W220_9PSEU
MNTPTRPPARHVPLLVLAVLATVGTSVLAVVVAGSTDPNAADTSWMPVAEVLPFPLALLVDLVGEPIAAPVVLAVVAGVCFRHGGRRAAVLAVVAPSVTVLSTTALKPLVGRHIHGEHLAFPSGHTAWAVALAGVLALTLTGRRVTAVFVGVAIPAALLMGSAQVTLNNHYPTDTVGGFGVALAIVPCVTVLIDKIADRAAARHA